MNNITPFNYGDNLIRVINDETTGEPLWVAKDVCTVLDLKDVNRSCSKLDEDEKLILKLFVSGQNRDMVCVNEAGLYNLIFRSNKPEAKPFKRWVTHEVLPAIRKTGSYSLNQNNSVDMSPILSIMETQSRILETMQVQNTLMMEMLHKILSNQDNAHFGISMILKGTTTIMQEVVPIFGGTRYTSFKDERMNSEQRSILYSAVNTRAAYLTESLSIKTDVAAAAIFAALKTRFQKSHYADISEYQFDEAVEFVNVYEISERR